MSRNGDCKQFKEQNTKNIRGVNVAKLNQSTCLIGKENVFLTEEEIREYFELKEFEKVLDRELSDLRIQDREFCSTEETMDLLHRYNDIRDATQAIMGEIAVANATTVRSLYLRYGLSAEED